jgi:hypothetical protein
MRGQECQKLCLMTICFLKQNSRDRLAMRARHGGEILRGERFPLWQRLGRDDVEFHLVAGNGVANGAEGFIARNCGRKQPQALPDRAGRLDQKNPAALRAEGAPVLSASDRFFGGLQRERGGIGGLAKPSDGTRGAIRLACAADRCPEIHERGGMMAPAFLWKKGSGGLMEEFLTRSCGDVFPKIEEPCDDALDIRIEDGDRLVESKSCHCRRRVGSNSRQRAQELQVAGDDPAELQHNCLGRAMEISGARVVAEAFPVFHDLLLRRAGEGCHIGKSFHPSLKKRLHCGNGCLLEHEFGNKHRVGRGIRPPRQDAAMGAKPFLERLVEISCGIF